MIDLTKKGHDQVELTLVLLAPTERDIRFRYLSFFFNKRSTPLRPPRSCNLASLVNPPFSLNPTAIGTHFTHNNMMLVHPPLCLPPLTYPHP